MVPVVPKNISKHLAYANLQTKRPFRVLSLTPKFRRLQWCQARGMWDIADWQNVVFSDEFRFILGTEINHVRVLKRPGERYNFYQLCRDKHCPQKRRSGLGGGGA